MPGLIYFIIRQPESIVYFFYWQHLAAVFFDIYFPAVRSFMQRMPDAWRQYQYSWFHLVCVWREILVFLLRLLIRPYDGLLYWKIRMVA